MLDRPHRIASLARVYACLRSLDRFVIPSLTRRFLGCSHARVCSCGKASVVVAADRSVIAFGGNVQHRELGLGPDGPKTASRPRKVDDCEGISVMQVACGLGHTLLLAEADENQQVGAMPKWGDDAGGKRKHDGADDSGDSKKAKA